MTLVNALESLKEKGVKRIVGFGPETDIDRYIQNAKDCGQQARELLKSCPDNGWARYHIEHEDDHFIIEVKGHYIVAATIESSLHPGSKSDIATYGTEYETVEEMLADFDEWSLKREADKIADKMMAERPGVLPRTGWVLIAIKELQKYKERAKAAFLKSFPPNA
jgi:hypothetical protein